MPPIYDFLCQECNTLQVDLQMSMNDATQAKILFCPKCQKQTNHTKQIGRTFAQFKGTGWTTPSHGAK